MRKSDIRNAPPLMSTAEAAEYLKCSARTVRNYIYCGSLKAIRPTPKGGSIKITKEALMSFCEMEVSA